MFYAIVQDNKIVCSIFTHNPDTTNKGLIEISEDIYKQLTRFPADFVQDENGNIISVTCPPEPDPPIVQEPIDEEKAALAEAIIDFEERISKLEAMLNA